MKEGSTQCQGALRHHQIHKVCGLSSVSNSVTQDKEPEVLVTRSRECRLTAKGYLQTDMAWPGCWAPKNPTLQCQEPRILPAMYSDPTWPQLAKNRCICRHPERRQDPHRQMQLAWPRQSWASGIYSSAAYVKTNSIAG